MQDEDVAFALKVIKKKHVVDNRQEEHIHSERKILAEARSPFVVKSVPSSSPQAGFRVLLSSGRARWSQGRLLAAAALCWRPAAIRTKRSLPGDGWTV